MVSDSPTSNSLPFQIVSSVKFSNFLPGHEAKKRIVLHNTSTKPQSTLVVQIQKLPQNSQYFAIPSYKPGWKLKIRKGLRKELPLVFRPLNLDQSLSDEIVLRIEERFPATSPNSTSAAKTGQNTLATTTQRKVYHHRIRLRAPIPQLSLQVSPKHVDFGLCAVRDHLEQTITLTKRSLHGKSNLPHRVTFEWFLDTHNQGSSDGGVFSIEPKSGELVGDQQIELKVRFHPREAMTASATAVCTINTSSLPGDSAPKSTDSPNLVLTMSGIGKYSFLTLSNNELHFGDVLVNQSCTKEFQIYNKSLVGSHFSVHRMLNHDSPEEVRDTDASKHPKKTQSLNVPSVFSFKPSSGYLPAEETTTVKVTYSPHTNLSVDNESFEIRTLDTNVTNKRRLLCEGRAHGPQVTIQSGHTINFGEVHVGKVVQRVLELKNNSPIYAEIEIIDAHSGEHSDANDAFVPVLFRLTSGTIAPNSSLKIPVTFSLKDPINFYQRFYISVRNQNSLYVDIIGNGCTDSEFPAPLTMKHVHAYRERCRMGMALTSPEELESLLKEDKSQMEAQQVEDRNKFENSLVDYTKMISDHQVMREYFSSALNKMDKTVSLDVSSISFGKCSSYKLSNVYQVVRVKNHTNSKMLCRPLVANIDGGRTRSPFIIFPEEGADIKPKSSCEFRIGFRPGSENQFYQQTIDFLCTYKLQRSFRLVNEKTIIPPFIAKLQVSGNTFADPGSLAPKAFLSPNQLVTFPSLLVHDVGYQTIVLRNAADIPLPFRISLSEDSSKDILPAGGKIFSVFPSEGQIEAGAFKLITFRFRPNQDRLFQSRATFYFNTTNQSKKILKLVGEGCIPRLEYIQGTGTSGMLLLKPTHAGASSRRSLQVRNPTRIPVSYRWNIPQDSTEFLSVHPASGEIAPNANFEFEAVFSPERMGSYSTEITCELLTENLRGSDTPSDLTFKVTGEASRGTCDIEPKQFDFGNIRVGGDSPITQLTLLNSSDCDLPYELVFCNRDDNGDLIVESSQELFCVDPQQRRGVIPARSYIGVRVQYKPKSRHYSRLAAICCLPLHHQSESSNSGEQQTTQSEDASPTIYPIPYNVEQLEKFPSCDMEGVGCLPHLGITDIYAHNVTKSNLWHQFSVNQINDSLADEPTTLPPVAKDIAFHSYIKHFKRFLLDFGAKTIGQEDTTVFVQLENIGKIDAEFALSFSNDAVVDVDRWAEDQGTRTEAQERELYIILNEIFTVTPKQAVLEPGERVTLQLTYQHKLAEVHSVPLIMSVRHGGPNIVLDLTGQTLNIDQVLLHFRSLQHWFKPVSIGTHQPPIQYYPLTNAADVETRYTVDTSALDDFSAENHGFTILDLENPDGIIPANGTILLKFIFNPLEAKDYHIELPISVQHGDTYFIHFYGKGVERPMIRDISSKTSHSQQGSSAMVEVTDADSQLDGNARSLDRFNNPGTVTTVPHRVPPVQTISFPNQLAKFSLDVLYLGEIPTFSVHKRLLVISNTSENDTIRFEWDTSLPLYPERGVTSKSEIEPSHGLIEPGQLVVCKVTYVAGAIPEYLDCDIMCRITNESERLRKEERRQLYEEEIKNVQDDETELGPSPKRSTLRAKKEPRKSVVERSVRETTAKSINFLSYRSSAEQLTAEYGMETRPTLYGDDEINEEDKYGLRTLPVVEMKVRLNAHVWNVDSYKDAYPSRYAQQYLPQIQSVVKDITRNDNVLISSGVCLKAAIDRMGKEFLSQFLQDTLQEVMEHDNVREASMDLKGIKTPYYAEFADVPSPVEEAVESLNSVPITEATQSVGEDPQHTASSSEDVPEEESEDEVADTEDLASESSHQGSIDLPDDMMISGGSQSRGVLDFEEETDEQVDEQEEQAKQKQYQHQMEMIREEEAIEELQPQYEENISSERSSPRSAPEINEEDLLGQPDFQNLLEWILDETCVNICTELMEQEEEMQMDEA